MVLAVGARLGAYEILAPLGAGGMGEVYRARDVRLNRIVALKIVRHASGSASLRERLVREARLTATLTHPHICVLHDIGRDTDLDYLVMEYVQGETLQARLDRGPLPLNEAIALAIQLADALDAAHHQGIVHRDLKPSNVMLTSGGAKLLDFGLARSREAVLFAGFTGTAGASTVPLLTAEGTLIGTLHYMAPEQLQGQEVDARADIFALGAVLYEALTGRRAFEGSSPASIIAAILERQPPEVSVLQPLAPAALNHVVQRCLAKQVEHRWQSARDLVHELTWIQRALDRGIDESPLPGSARSTSVRAALRGRFARWTAAAVAAAAAAVALWFLGRAPAAPAPPVRRLTVVLPAGERLALARTTPVGLARVAIALSPDGTTLVYAGSRLYVRPLDSFVTRALAKTEGAYAPVFSPDGQWIAFLSGGTLKKVPLSGGDPLVLCESKNAMALGWADRGIVLLDQFATRLALVSPDGGVPKALGPGGNTLGILPDADAVLVSGGLFNNPDRSIIEVVSLATGRRTTLPTRGVQPRYMAEGFLTFGRGGMLFAVPFDARLLQVTGPELAVEHGVRMEVPATAQYAVSDEGTLAYVPGGVGWNSQLVWVNGDGGEIPIDLPLQPYGSFRLSPDGRRLAFVHGGVTDDIWLLDFERRVSRRLTHEGNNGYPVWTADGARLIFLRASEEGESIWWTAVDDQGSEERLTAYSRDNQRPFSTSPDGRLLAYAGRSDVFVLELSGARLTHSILGTSHIENMPIFSPDGRSLAYTSDESGRTEVYVRRFSDGARAQISNAGGEEPVWTRDGRRLFYRNGDRWMVSELKTGVEFLPPTLALQGAYLNVPGMSYDVAHDGRLLLMRGIEGEVDASAIHVVSNFVEELRRSTLRSSGDRAR